MRVGVEHEYRLWRGTEQVDFRTLIPHVAPGLRTLDPGDPRARRLPSGVALTADGWEAELATPPLELSASAADRIDHLLRSERTELLAAGLTVGVDRVTGYSTHLNVSVDDDVVVDLGHTFARSCLAALAEVLEPAVSSGLFVRPRRGRLEVGGEYAEGDDLVAALTLYAASVAGLLAGTTPPRLEVPGLVPSREKFGWFAASLPTGQLAEVWSWARPAALAHGLEPRVLDELATGTRALRRDRVADPSACSTGVAPAAVVDTDLGRRVLRGGVVAETEWLTWDHVVWVFTDRRGRSCRAVVPVQAEAGFLADLDDGRHDEELRRLLRRRLRPLRLQRHAQVDGLTWWQEVRPGALVPAERSTDGTLPPARTTTRDAYGRRGPLTARITASQDPPTDGST